MNEFDAPSETQKLKLEMLNLIRKMLAVNIYAEEECASIFRGIRYEEMASLPPACERH